MSMYKKIRGAILAAGLIASVGIFCACSGDSGDESNVTYEDLESYMGIVDVDGNPGMAVVVNGECVGNGFTKDNSYYIPYSAVREYIDNHYYWDSEEMLLTYASSKHIYDALQGATEYTADGEMLTHGSEIVIYNGEEAYIDKDYILLMNEAMNTEYYEEPSRIVFNTLPMETVAVATEDTVIRTGDNNGEPIVADVEKDGNVFVLAQEEVWSLVATKDGLSGYIRTDCLTDISDVSKSYNQSWITKEPYSYISKEGTICLGWHQMEYAEGNDSLNGAIAGADSLNVISPTWFKIADGYGGITSLASKSYVNKAHDNGLEVWGLISDFNYDDEGNYYINSVISSTSNRRKLIENIMEEALECGMDGINIDFEMIRQATAEGYVQFVRELAIQCEKNNLVLSVDMYVPTESNAYYDRAAVGEVADYLVIMGYDEHWAGCGEAGSVASLPFVTEGISDTLDEVPAKRVINAVPFYTRVWYEDTLENAPEGSIVVEDSINGDYALSSKAVGMSTARELIEDNGGSFRWLEDVGQYYGECYIGERLARVWLEDKESLAAKLDVMKQNGLAGVACWKLGLESSEAWDAIGAYMQ